MKEPHNYRKVGYSMIVISISLTIIGLVVWAIGNNYHFASELMAGQEIDAMTPKQGYNIVSFDYSAPIGAKLKMLDHADSLNATKKLQDQYQHSTNGFQILIFGNSRTDNLDSVAHAEVAAFTPAQGYNVIFFNHAMPVGAKLAMNKHDDLLVNATTDEQKQQSDNKDPDVSVIIFSSSFEDNLKMVLGSGSSAAVVNVLPVTNTSGTTMSNGNQSMIIAENLNTTSNMSSPTTGQETLSLTEKVNATTTNGNQTITNGSKKSVNLSENIGITSK